MSEIIDVVTLLSEDSDAELDLIYNNFVDRDENEAKYSDEDESYDYDGDDSSDDEEEEEDDEDKPILQVSMVRSKRKRSAVEEEDDDENDADSDCDEPIAKRRGSCNQENELTSSSEDSDHHSADSDSDENDQGKRPLITEDKLTPSLLKYGLRSVEKEINQLKNHNDFFDNSQWEKRLFYLTGIKEFYEDRLHKMADLYC